MTPPAWILVMLLSAAPSSAPALPPEVDEAVFRDGLRQRGLQSWLDQYLEQTPAIDDADRLLREREALLAEAIVATSSEVRQARQRDATARLREAIARLDDDPRGLRCRFELARDLLERQAPEAFDSILLFELTGPRRAQVMELSAAALQELDALRERIARAWSGVESLNEADLARLRLSTSMRQLEQLDGQATLLRAWAQLYELLCSASSPQREKAAGALLDAVAAAGWTESQPGQEARQSSALVLSCVAARLGRRMPEADQFARRIVALSQQVGATNALSQASLVAVLEQVRALRDAGSQEAAASAVKQVAAWASRQRAGDAATLIAVALLERSVLIPPDAATQAGATDSVANVLLPSAGLPPLLALLQQPPAIRDALYRAIALNVGSTTPDADGPLTLWAGAHVAAGDASIVEALSKRLTTDNAQGGAPHRAELWYLLGEARHRGRDRGGAIRAWIELANRWPASDRAEAATYRAVAAAREWLTEAKESERRAARDAFVSAAATLSKRAPSAAAPLQFFVGAALEANGDWMRAATEYARVAPADPHHVRAQVGRLRCLAHDLRTTTSQPAATQSAEGQAAIGRAMDAGQAAMKAASQADAPDPCLTCEAGVQLASLFNSAVARPAEALRVLDEVQPALKTCPDWLGPALRERMEALRQLGRWEEARRTLEAFIERDRSEAGGLGASLLDATRQAVLRALEDGDERTAQAIARQGAALAESLSNLLTGASQPADNSLALTRAWLLVQGGDAARALPLYESCAAAQSIGTDETCALGRAGCLLALGRPADALPIYAAWIEKLPEHSASWWEAYVGTLRCHEQTRDDRRQIVQSIRQQRRLAPDLGGPRWRRMLEAIESRSAAVP